MNKGSGVGVGSASIVLVFAVLCLSVFSLITFVIAGNSKTLSETEARLVTGYYEADALAERIIHEIIKAEITPESVMGIDIVSEWAWEQDAYLIRFLCPISGGERYLHVQIALNFDNYEILSWRMRNDSEWTTDDGLNVWLPDDSFDIWLGLDNQEDLILH